MLKLIFLQRQLRFHKLVLTEPCQHLTFPPENWNNQHHWKGLKYEGFYPTLATFNWKNQMGTRKLQKSLIWCPCSETQPPTFSYSERGRTFEEERTHGSSIVTPSCHRWHNWCTERISDLPKVTQWVTVKAEASAPSVLFLPLRGDVVEVFLAIILYFILLAWYDTWPYMSWKKWKQDTRMVVVFFSFVNIFFWWEGIVKNRYTLLVTVTMFLFSFHLF